jgi:osmotically-inducible protein OsmY
MAAGDLRGIASAALAVALLAGLACAPLAQAGEQAAAGVADPDADNTEKNVRDRDEGSVTPLDQSNEKADLEVTQRIRQGLIDDDDLSTNAKNVKVVTTTDGRVTLRGPVDSATEKAQIVKLAENVAGPDRQVVDQLEVAAP